MIPVPSRRWLTVAVSLAVIAPVAAVWRPAALVLVLLDLCWVAALVADAVLVSGVDGRERIGVARVAPAALSVGRPAVVDYEWISTSARRSTLLVRERFPDALGRPAGADRRLDLRPHEHLREHLTITPAARGPAAGGSLTLRVLGPLGLVWRQESRSLPWDVTVFPSLQGVALKALPVLIERLATGNSDDDRNKLPEFHAVTDIHVGVVSTDLGLGGVADAHGWKPAACWSSTSLVTA